MNSVRPTPILTVNLPALNVRQPQKRQMDTGPRKSIQEFLQHPFDERGVDDVPHAQRQDDLSKKIKLEVADFSRQCDTRAFLFWLYFY